MNHRYDPGTYAFYLSYALSAERKYDDLMACYWLRKALALLA